MLPNRPLSRSIALLALSLSSAGAEEVVLRPSADTAIYGGAGETDANAGLSPYIPSGGRGEAIGGAPVRLLIKFDLTSDIPAGATITAASLKMHLFKTPAGEPRSSTFGFHKMLVPWIEGRANSGFPGAADAEPGEPTWNNRAHPDTPWGSPGGEAGTDYESVPGITREVLAGNSENFPAVFTFSPAGLADLQAMADSPSSNHGWILISNRENIQKTARLWASKDPIAGLEEPLTPPELAITFTLAPVAPPEDFTIILGDGKIPTLTFTRAPDVAYEVESSSLLLPPEWSPFRSVPASPSGGLESIPLTIPFPEQQYFRIFRK